MINYAINVLGYGHITLFLEKKKYTENTHIILLFPPIFIHLLQQYTSTLNLQQKGQPFHI